MVYRFRMVMTHDRPPLTAYDQDAVGRASSVTLNADAREALEEFTMVSRSNIRLFERASPDGLESSRDCTPSGVKSRCVIC